MDSQKKKCVIIILCLFGVLATTYGMMKKNHPVFIVGLSLVVIAYLIIRNELKSRF